MDQVKKDTLLGTTLQLIHNQFPICAWVIPQSRSIQYQPLMFLWLLGVCGVDSCSWAFLLEMGMNLENDDSWWLAVTHDTPWINQKVKLVHSSFFSLCLLGGGGGGSYPLLSCCHHCCAPQCHIFCSLPFFSSHFDHFPAPSDRYLENLLKNNHEN